MGLRSVKQKSEEKDAKKKTQTPTRAREIKYHFDELSLDARTISQNTPENMTLEKERAESSTKS